MNPLTRRGFIGSTAALAATSVLRADDKKVAANDTLNVALIGAGGQGQRILDFCLRNQGTRCVAICEILPGNFDAANSLAKGSAKQYDDWNEMLAKEDLDAVLIGLPEHTHHPAAIAAMKAGCHVFCEKPMAYSLEQGHEMIRVNQETGKVLQIGQQRRANPLYYHAAELLQEQKLVGDVIRVDAFWDRWEDWKRPLPNVNMDFAKWGFPSLNHLVNWRLYRAYGHGLMTENGTHQLDATMWLLGGKRPKVVNGVGVSKYHDGRETHDVVVANFIFDDDIVVRFSQDFHQGYNFGWGYGELVLGDRGSLRLIEQMEMVFQPKGKGSPVRPPLAEMNKGQGWEIPGIKLTAKQLAELKIEWWFGYDAELRSFVHCCRHNVAPACTATIGHNSIVPTIVGTEAQFENRTITFKKEWWA